MSETTAGPLSRGAYLVVLDDYLVSQDLAETIRYFDPEAQVIARPTTDDAVAAVAPVARIELAFVADGPSHFAASPLAGMIRCRGGRVVLLGPEAETAGKAAGWPVLHRPFSQSLVLAHLAGLRSD
jgi:hypothetical protein